MTVLVAARNSLRRRLENLAAAQVRPALIDVRGPLDRIVQDRRRLDDLTALALVRATLVSRRLHHQSVDGPLYLRPALRVRGVSLATVLALDVHRHLELTAARSLNQHQHHLILLRLSLAIPPPLVFGRDQLMLKVDQILLRQIAILLIIVVRLKLVKHFLELATVLLQLLTADLPHLVRRLEVLNLLS